MRIPALLAAALCAAVLAPPALAAADGAEAQVADDRFAAGGSIRQSKPVEGDFFGFGGNVDLSAAVGGDAVLAGGDVRVREPVSRDLYAAGGSVRVEAAVAGNARLAGGNVELSPEGSVGGNLSIGGGSIEIRGRVGGNVQVGGGDVLVDSAVSGDVRVASGELTLGPNARIAGKLVHHGPAKVQRDPAAQVDGGIAYRESPRVRSEIRKGNERGIRSGVGWFWTIGLVVLAATIAAAFPTGARRMGEDLRSTPGLALLFGFIALVCVPVAALLLMVTIVGIPLALVLLLLYFLLLMVGYAAAAVVIGDAALAKLRSQDAARMGWRIGAAMLAMLALALLGRIPILGGLVVFVALLAGVGAIVLALQARTRASPGAPPPAPA